MHAVVTLTLTYFFLFQRFRKQFENLKMHASGLLFVNDFRSMQAKNVIAKKTKLLRSAGCIVGSRSLALVVPLPRRPCASGNGLRSSLAVVLDFPVAHAF